MITISNYMEVAYKASKLFAVLFTSSIACFSLFVLMGKLVEDNKSHAVTKSAPVTITLATVDEDSKVNEIEKALPEKPEIKPVPKPVATPDDSPGEQQLAGDAGWEFELQPTHTPTDMSNQMRDVSAIPIVRVTPKYPTKAAAEGIEGWVQLSFTIDEIGRVVDVKVVDAEPKRMFDREARKALKKWKYRPQLVDGEAVKQTDQFVVLEFNMAQS